MTMPVLQVVKAITLVCLVSVLSSISSSFDRRLLNNSQGVHSQKSLLDKTNNISTSLYSMSLDLDSIKPNSVLSKQGDQDPKKNLNYVTVEPTDYIYNEEVLETAPIVIEKYKLVFFTVPKVGCTIWKKLFRRMMGYQDWKTTEPHDPETNGLVYLSHYNTSRATEIMNDPEYTKAIFLRDPKERLLSAYMDKVVSSNGQGFALQCCPDKSCLPKAQTLAGFILLTQTTCRGNAHWLQQSKRMDTKYLKQIDFVGHMETVDLDAKRLLRRIGAWKQVGKRGWGPPTGRIFEGQSMISHATSTGAKDSWSRLSKHYTPDLESLVEGIYREDYALKQFNLTMKKIQF
jgi:hypothetical protein